MDELVLILKRLALRFAAPSLAPQIPGDQGAWCMEPGCGFIAAPNGVRVRLSVIDG
jgi:hypothetical protein